MHGFGDVGALGGQEEHPSATANMMLATAAERSRTRYRRDEALIAMLRRVALNHFRRLDECIHRLTSGS